MTPAFFLLYKAITLSVVEKLEWAHMLSLYLCSETTIEIELLFRLKSDMNIQSACMNIF